MARFYPYIAIGHGISTDGSWDCGCTYAGFTEADLAKEVVAGILEVFDANGKSYVTDYPSNNKNIVACVAEANSRGCSHYLSVHLDWEKAPSGIFPVVCSDSGIGMAQAIRASMKLRIPGLNDRGNCVRDDYEVANTNMPAVIMEIGSIKADLDLIRNNTRLFGHAIAYGIMDYAGESYNALGEGAVQSAPVTAAPAGSPKPANTVASSGYTWDTEDIQYFLNICNYGAPEIDGIDGPETRSCIRNAQQAYGITVDGIWGPVTQAKAEQQIRGYQTQLTAKGSPCGIDGIAGPGTYGSVLDFQRRNGLEMDGIVGPQTYAKLFDVSAPAAAPTAPATGGTDSQIRNFGPDEFKCECGCGGDVEHELKVKVQRLRDLLTQRAGGDRPLVITSGFRCPTQNARDGGVPDSLHMYGRATDLYTPGMSRAMVDEISYCAHQVGLGVLRYYDSLFCHVQLDPADRTME